MSESPEIPPLGLATGSAIRFPNPPRFTERDDTPAEYALEVSDGVPGGCIVHGLYTKYRDKPEWVTNCSSRALIRMLLARADAAEKEKLDAQARNVELAAQLPDGMKHCTIVYKSCELGHGWLTATNWVQHGCPTCERNRLRDELAAVTKELHRYDSAATEARNTLTAAGIPDCDESNRAMGLAERIEKLHAANKRLAGHCDTLLAQLTFQQQRADAANIDCAAILAALTWEGDGYSWNPPMGDYRERPADAMYRGAKDFEKQMAALKKENEELRAKVSQLPDIISRETKEADEASAAWSDLYKRLIAAIREMHAVDAGANCALMSVGELANLETEWRGRFRDRLRDLYRVAGIMKS